MKSALVPLQLHTRSARTVHAAHYAAMQGLRLAALQLRDVPGQHHNADALLALASNIEARCIRALRVLRSASDTPAAYDSPLTDDQ